MEETWARKSDSDVINAIRQFDRYTASGQNVIRAEAMRRAITIDELSASSGEEGKPPLTGVNLRSQGSSSAEYGCGSQGEPHRGGTRVVKWLVRTAAAFVSAVLVLLSMGLFHESSSYGNPHWAMVFFLATGFHLTAAALTFTIFFSWRKTRVAHKPRGRASDRAVAGLLIGFGALGILTVVAAVIVLVDFPLTDLELLWMLSYLSMASLVSGATGLGMWTRAQWARRAALVSGFMSFGAVPVGTLLALELWRFAKTQNSEAGPHDAVLRTRNEEILTPAQSSAETGERVMREMQTPNVPLGAGRPPRHDKGRPSMLTAAIWSLAVFALCVGWATAINSARGRWAEPWPELLEFGTWLGALILLASSLGAGLTYTMTRDRTKVLGAWIFLLLLAVMGLSIGNAQNMRLEVERQFRSLPEEGEVGAYIKRLRRYLMTKAEARLPVDELLAEYETNRFAAEARYESTPKGTCARLYGLGKCQRVDVIAVVDDMGRDSDGHPYLSLRSAIAKGLRAEFTPDTEPAELADLRLGQTLMVRCEPVYDGRLRLINCLLAPDPASFEPSVESY